MALRVIVAGFVVSGALLVVTLTLSKFALPFSVVRPINPVGKVLSVQEVTNTSLTKALNVLPCATTLSVFALLMPRQNNLGGKLLCNNYLNRLLVKLHRH